MCSGPPEEVDRDPPPPLSELFWLANLVFVGVARGGTVGVAPYPPMSDFKKNTMSKKLQLALYRETQHWIKQETSFDPARHLVSYPPLPGLLRYMSFRWRGTRWRGTNWRRGQDVCVAAATHAITLTNLIRVIFLTL